MSDSMLDVLDELEAADLHHACLEAALQRAEAEGSSTRMIQELRKKMQLVSAEVEDLQLRAKCVATLTVSHSGSLTPKQAWDSTSGSTHAVDAQVLSRIPDAIRVPHSGSLGSKFDLMPPAGFTAPNPLDAFDGKTLSEDEAAMLQSAWREEAEAFIAACRGGDLATLEKRLASCQVPSDEELDLGLLHASAEGHHSIVIALISAGADPNHGHEVGYGTALQIAARAGHPDVVRILLEHGADPCVGEYDGALTALHEAASNCQVEVATLLLDAGANPDARACWEAQPGGLTPLDMAERSRRKIKLEYRQRAMDRLIRSRLEVWTNKEGPLQARALQNLLNGR